ncbi:AcrR family transcriptional regulator [Catenulispora sp. GAS73]|uniref:TetR/AcrR family transcriptional regulator n=1 Tax=Catenulispora sp. GAS73 TaxID=3156269 RepID=UPI003515ED9B
MPEPEPYRSGDKPYHHGSLRAALLAAAERTLREQGVEQVTLRELARQAGVSHGAPSRHFRDRQALLEELAAVGFARLGDGITAATEKTGGDFAARLRAAATAYVRFALDNPALLELMMTGGGTDGREPAAKVYQRPYLILKELIRQGHESGELRPGDPERLLLIIMATFQGIAGLVSSLKMPLEQAEALVADATTLFVGGPAGGS